MRATGNLIFSPVAIEDREVVGHIAYSPVRKVRESQGTFDSYIWSFTDGQVVHNAWKALQELPGSTPLSDAVSKALKKEGFSFVGSTICYAFLQAGGVVNDHVVHCFRHKELIDG